MVARRVKSNGAVKLNSQAAGDETYRALEQLADVLADIARGNIKNEVIAGEVTTAVKRAHPSS